MFLFIILCTNLWANSTPYSWYSQDSDKKVTINVALFLSSTCPYCHKSDAFFKEIEASYPWVHVTRYIINEDKNALLRFSQLLTEQDMLDFSVPSVFFCDSRWVGFAAAETTGADLLHAINYCKQDIEKKGTLSPATVKVLKRWANANMFNSGVVGNPSTTKYITTVALLDAFSPCALFCIICFFAFLFLQERRKKQVITGLLFILAVGIVHYVQQVYISTFYQLLPWYRLPALLVGLLTLYLMYQYYKKKTIHNLLVLLAFPVAFMVLSYQQTCVMNWSNIFEQWLDNQHVSSGRAILYQAAYHMMYLLPLIVTLLLYILLIRVKFFVNLSPKLNCIGLLYLTTIALILIIYPLALSNLMLSLLITIILIVCGWILSRYTVYQ